jgi:hypothetical protein
LAECCNGRSLDPLRSRSRGSMEGGGSCCHGPRRLAEDGGGVCGGVADGYPLQVSPLLAFAASPPSSPLSLAPPSCLQRSFSSCPFLTESSLGIDSHNRNFASSPPPFHLLHLQLNPFRLILRVALRSHSRPISCCRMSILVELCQNQSDRKLQGWRDGW